MCDIGVCGVCGACGACGVCGVCELTTRHPGRIVADSQLAALAGGALEATGLANWTRAEEYGLLVATGGCNGFLKLGLSWIEPEVGVGAWLAPTGIEPECVAVGA